MSILLQVKPNEQQLPEFCCRFLCYQPNPFFVDFAERCLHKRIPFRMQQGLALPFRTRYLLRTKRGLRSQWDVL
jgi:hypothetical protein